MVQVTALVLALVFTFGLGAPAVLAGDEAKAMAAGGEERDYSDGAMVFDALMLRPMGLAATVFGTGVFLVSLPFTLVSGDVERTGSKLVADPLRYTFTRPLGDI